MSGNRDEKMIIRLNTNALERLLEDLPAELKLELQTGVVREVVRRYQAKWIDKNIKLVLRNRITEYFNRPSVDDEIKVAIETYIGKAWNELVDDSSYLDRKFGQMQTEINVRIKSHCDELMENLEDVGQEMFLRTVVEGLIEKTGKALAEKVSENGKA